MCQSFANANARMVRVVHTMHTYIHTYIHTYLYTYTRLLSHPEKKKNAIRVGLGVGEGVSSLLYYFSTWYWCPSKRTKIAQPIGDGWMDGCCNFPCHGLFLLNPCKFHGQYTHTLLEGSLEGGATPSILPKSYKWLEGESKLVMNEPIPTIKRQP